MSQVYVIGDLHLGHRRVLGFSPNRLGQPVSSIEEHDRILIERWNSVVQKRDVVWVLGDIAFGAWPLEAVRHLKGQKFLIRGNHDKLSTQTYLQYFNNVYGIVKKYGVWLSHAPIHPAELRGFRNIHGHVHNQSILIEKAGNLILDDRYINVSIEANNGYPQNIKELLK